MKKGKGDTQIKTGFKGVANAELKRVYRLRLGAGAKLCANGDAKPQQYAIVKDPAFIAGESPKLPLPQTHGRSVYAAPPPPLSP